MFNDKDFMGGMFDFDGNGKTTLYEQYVAYKIYEIPNILSEKYKLS